MPAHTVHDGSDFRGTSRSYTTLHASRSWATCRSCGSTLYPSRFERAGVRTIGGSRMTVDRYRRRCGKAMNRRAAA